MKSEISLETCERDSPCRRVASGSAVSWLSDSRASLRCCFAAWASTCPLAGACDPAVADCVGCDGVDGSGFWAAVGACAGDAASGDCAAALDGVASEGAADAEVVGFAEPAAALFIELDDGVEPIVSAALDAGEVFAAADGGVVELELIAAANAVTCFRTSRSFSFDASSSEDALPDVPVAPGALADGAVEDPVSDPIRSVMILSMAPTSVPHFEAAVAELFDFGADPAAGVLSAAPLRDASFSRSFRCVRICEIFPRALAGTLLG